MDNNWNSFDTYRPESNEGGDRLVGRVMAAEYNLAVQRGDQKDAARALGRGLGWLLQRFFA